MPEFSKCPKCRCYREPQSFLNAKGRKLKTCQNCRDFDKKYREKRKCEHGRIRSQCKECGGSQICIHKRIKSTCRDCGGASICIHDRRRSECKECGGSSICEHGRIRSQCKECGGSQICIHKRQRSTCKECGGSQICEHKRQRSHCKECGGGSICIHGRIRSRCKECGGASICEHKREKSICKECGGGQICEHKRRKPTCKICDPNGYLCNIIRSRCRSALKSNKSKRSLEYLGCTVEEFKHHLESTFSEGMTWENQGKWHIDHIIPLKYKNPTLEETIKRLHYKNTQALWATDNIAKGNRFIG